MKYKCDVCGAEIRGIMFAGTDEQGNKHEIKVCFDCAYERSRNYWNNTPKKDGEHNADRK